MREEFIHYLWKFKLFHQKDLQTTKGEKIEVLNCGEHNTNAGPDFISAKIRIGDKIWGGNVEIHINANDWKKHNHDKDEAYNTIILHVVLNNNYQVTRTNGEEIATLELQYDKNSYLTYKNLINNDYWIACEDIIKKIDHFHIKHWLTTVFFTRLEQKSEYIKETLNNTQNNWGETFYLHLARNFGFNINAVPFELLAKSLPLNLLGKHKDNLLQIESLLFGQAGLLNDDMKDDYYLKLKKEYHFLKHKYKLTPIDTHLWRFLRIRPINFPTIRIAQLSMLIYQSQGLFSKILEAEEFNEVYSLFKVKTSNYWKNHYTFGKISAPKEKNLGEMSLQNIIINTIIPITFLYGMQKDTQKYKDKMIDWAEKLKPEKNSIIKHWEEIKIKAENAFYSQALLELKKNYCDKKRCIECSIGDQIIQNKL